MKKMKAKRWKWVPLFLLGILASLIGGCQALKPADALSVAGTPMSAKVYRLFLQNEKALTVNRYVTKYHAKYNAQFWQTKYGRQTPQQAAQAQAMNKLKQFVIEDQALVKAKLLTKPLAEFDGLKKTQGTGADLTGMAAAQKQHRELMLKLQAQYVKTHRKSVTSQQQTAFYRQHKRKYWARPDLIHYETLTFEPGKISDLSEFTELVQRFNGQQTDLASVQKAFGTAGFHGQLGQNDSLHDADQYYGAYLRATNDQTGHVGQIFAAWLSDQKMSLVRVTASAKGGFVPFSDVKEDVTAKILQAQLAKTLEKRAKQAEVQGDPAQLAKETFA
ncbi:hypothetical protein [Lacticaseibacillus zeae]|uniref:Peptidylprolyl isomerase n=1 Tax=Lacticaseibacillus zeae subsp. silagei TaxID=3068307 RepID=A0ABD7Z8K2_LACZE|nr:MULTISPECIES: hypothetical protein [Lacticaseibacillus]MDE3316590.1 hypothetical protein [Lacticaseibacillus zeae]WLV83386.1 hypothetical protein LACZS2_002622 [Lacticaseibacillus sp. NCIMB 15475]WLV86135.1 hypothetical protein LACZS1_002571 [Lacticaseibacillus sp. NCIMB 15474]